MCTSWLIRSLSSIWRKSHELNTSDLSRYTNTPIYMSKWTFQSYSHVFFLWCLQRTIMACIHVQHSKKNVQCNVNVHFLALHQDSKKRYRLLGSRYFISVSGDSGKELPGKYCQRGEISVAQRDQEVVALVVECTSSVSRNTECRQEWRRLGNVQDALNLHGIVRWSPHSVS